MSAPIPIHSESHNTSRLIDLTLRACELAKSASGKAADAMASGNLELLATIDQDERELDRIDHEMDDAAVFAITESTVREARELLTCMKFVIDLERIGDLLSSFAGRATAVFPRIAQEDREDFVRMATVLEQMIDNARRAFLERDINRALGILKSDAVIDRLRNLIFIRHVEQHDSATPGSIQVLFMAQALERAGDHAKNLGEEVCHYVSGRTVRHLARENDKCYEQLFIDWIRDKHKLRR